MSNLETRKTMREKGIEPLRRIQAADPKSASAPADGPLPLYRSRTTPHDSAPFRAVHATPGVTRRRAVELVCRRRGHLLAGWNLMVSSGRRRCRECHNAYARARAARLAERGSPLLTVRCASCRGVYEAPLDDIAGAACPHCGKIARGAAA